MTGRKMNIRGRMHKKIRNSEFVSPHTKNPSLQRVIFMNSGNVKDLDHKH